MPKVLPLFQSLLIALPRVLTVHGILVLIVCAYGFTAWVADLGDTMIGPVVLQEALRAMIAVQIARAFWLRWHDFTPDMRLYLACLAAGMAMNLARSHFSATPLTLSYALVHFGLVGITWRLMVATRREMRLARKLLTMGEHLAQETAARLAAEARVAELERQLAKGEPHGL